MVLKYEDLPNEYLREYGVTHNKNKHEQCFVCKEETIWFDTYFKVPSCSPKCSRLVSSEILKEVQRLNEVVTKLERRIDSLLGG